MLGAPAKYYQGYLYGLSLGSGGICSVIAAVLWLIGAIGVFRLAGVSPTVGARGTINITETIEPDGKIITEKTTISSDGIKTIERTIEKQSKKVVGVEQPLDKAVDAAHDVAMETEP
jgi:hypothetical protein